MKKELEKHQVPPGTETSRLSDYVAGKFVSISSKKGMKKAISKGLVKVNEQRGTTGKYVNAGDIITLHADPLIENKVITKVELDVLFEDNHLAIIHKPAGIIMSGNKKHTIENALPHNLSKSELPDALPRPLPVHRLDFPTSGTLLIAKTSSAVTELGNMFARREINKIYHAIVQVPEDADLDDKGTIDKEIKGKSAVTEYSVLKRIDSPKFNQLVLLELSPITGRRHQLRIHLSDKGTPILGDQTYGIDGQTLKGKGLFLHASKIEFKHPFEEITASAASPLPNKFDRILQNKISTTA